LGWSSSTGPTLSLTRIGEVHEPHLRQQREASSFLAYEDEVGAVFDFHSLRHQYISNLVAAGIHPKIAQTLARHSTISQTLDRYTHLGVYDVASTVNKLPAIAFTAASSKADQAAIADVLATHGRAGFATAWLRRKGLEWAAELLEPPPAPAPETPTATPEVVA
jgi:hypothetical protein